MEVIPTEIPAVKILCPKRHGDHRGFFSEVFSEKSFREHVGVDSAFVQDNHSMPAQKGVLRGFHSRGNPTAQCRRLRVAQVASVDIAAAIRRGSRTVALHSTSAL